MKGGQLDKVDVKLLRVLAADGPQFWPHPGHERRAYEMVGTGYCKKQSAVYAVKSGGKCVEYRNLYTITAKGRAALAEALAEGKGV